jgi:hypothetical protein
MAWLRQSLLRRWRRSLVFMKAITCQPNELAIMAKYGKKANPGADDPARLEMLADWHRVQFRPRLVQMYYRVHWAFVCPDCRWNRVSLRRDQFERRVPWLAPGDQTARRGSSLRSWKCLALGCHRREPCADRGRYPYWCGEHRTYSKPSSFTRGIYAMGLVSGRWNQGVAVPLCVFGWRRHRQHRCS